MFTKFTPVSTRLRYPLSFQRAQLTVSAEPLFLESAFPINRVSVHQGVDSLSCRLVKPKNEPRIRALPIGKAKTGQSAADLMRIQPEGLIEPSKCHIYFHGQFLLGALSNLLP